MLFFFFLLSQLRSTQSPEWHDVCVCVEGGKEKTVARDETDGERGVGRIETRRSSPVFKERRVKSKRDRQVEWRVEMGRSECTAVKM